MAAEKESPEKKYCLFHQKTDCCNVPVINNRMLRTRLEHHVKLNELLNKHEPDAAKKEKRIQESILYENRLNDLRD